MPLRRLSLLCSLLFPFLTPAPTLHGQSETATLHGKVVDQTNTPIAGARIAALAPGGASQARATAGPSGDFTLATEPGRYTLHIAAPGFTELSRPIELPLASADSLDFILQLAPVNGAITVRDGPAYAALSTSAATKTNTPLLGVPQSVSVVTSQQIADRMMMSVADVVRYVPGVTAIQGENNRDQLVIRGNSTSADFFLNGVRDDVQYYRDLYNIERVEILKGPNALIFGRGGGGGVVNRVTKDAEFNPLREITLEGGSYGHKRVTADFDQPVSQNLAFRVNGIYEHSGSFRDFVKLERYGVTPSLTLSPNAATKLTFTYEYFRDLRTADRGVPSYHGEPVDAPITTFFGDPNNSNVHALVNLGSVSLERQQGAFSIRDRALIGDYDRGYQNFVPGAVSADGVSDILSAYNNATSRRNLFNQTDFTYRTATGPLRHTFLAGAEEGRQLTDNLRNTGYFKDTATSTSVPLNDPLIRMPVTFRQSATDANNHLTTSLLAGYAQDQIELWKKVQLVAGVRFDSFDLHYLNNRTADRLARTDRVVSPRAGIVFKPRDMVSLYGSYSVSFLPSSGDQFSSLTTVTQQVKPEKFTNLEAGAKWELHRSLSLTAALYRLDRTNTRSTDPNDPTRIVQTGSQRTNGVEIGAAGNLTRAWTVAGGYSYQDAFVSAATASARAGAQVGQTPHNTFSLWNRYELTKRVAAGFGLLNRSAMFAAIDDTVTLPGYTRADGAVFVSLTERTRFQVNVENLFDRKYYVNADSNTNISPGSWRTIRAGFTARF